MMPRSWAVRDPCVSISDNFLLLPHRGLAVALSSTNFAWRLKRTAGRFSIVTFGTQCDQENAEGVAGLSALLLNSFARGAIAWPSARHKKFTAPTEQHAHPAVILSPLQPKAPKTMPQEASRTLRVLIVSDVRVVQEGLHSVLAGREKIDVVSAVDTEHAREQSARLHPDVILFDAARHDSVELLKDLVASAPDSRVVAFGVKETNEEILALAAAGTAGYVCNSAETSDVVEVLERVMCDELPCSPRAAASLYRRVAALSRGDTDPVGTASGHGTGIGSGDSNGNGHARGVPLSRRELQIAQLIDCGLTNKQIGRELGIEAATVKNHVHNLCEKLDVHRRGEAAARIRAISRAQLSAPAPDANPALEAR
jgi:DNA-binding NarL/FixJ family response regulator